MTTIIFPGIHFMAHVSPVAFQIGNISVYWYAIIMVVAMLIAIYGSYQSMKKDGITFDTILDLLLWLLPISLIGARLFYILFSFEKFQTNPWDIFNLKTGGMAIYGGILAGAVVLYFFCKKKKLSFWDILDSIVPYLALGQAIGRWGNFLNQEAYGSATSLPWRMGIIENGIYQEVHPTFLYESLLDFTIFALLLFLRKKRKFSGELSYIYIVLYSFGRIFIENIRTDSLMLGKFRISQILSIFFLVTFCYIFVYKIEKERKKEKNRIKQEKMTYEKHENSGKCRES